MNVLTSMPLRGRLILGASVLGTIAVMFFLFRMATAPDYATLVAGVNANQTSKVTTALDQAGIPYKLTNNGAGVEVPAAQVAQAKVALAGAGVQDGAGTQPGYELLDNQKLGSSNLQQQVAYQRAKEGEIANTVSEMNGINGATVQLSLPQDQLFADESKPASAGVVLDVDAGSVDPAQVRGIANLVASSVEGLKSSNVTITSSSGELLWPTGEDGTGTGGSTAKLAAENRYAAQQEAKLNSMLVGLVGQNKGYVQMRPTLNIDETSREKLTYANRGTSLSRRTENETLQATGESAGAAGARANIQGAAQNGAGSTSDYQRRSSDEQFGVGKTIERTKVAPGTVQRLDLAIVLDKSVKPNDQAAIRNAISTAAGIDAQRGDTITLSSVAFAKPPAPPKTGGPVPKQAVGAAKWVGLGIASLLFLFFVTRSIRKREGEVIGDATWLTEIDEPRPLAALTGGSGGAGGEGGEGGELAEPSVARRQVTAAVDNEPERVAQQLRAWMAEEG